MSANEMYRRGGGKTACSSAIWRKRNGIFSPSIIFWPWSFNAITSMTTGLDDACTSHHVLLAISNLQGNAVKDRGLTGAKVTTRRRVKSFSHLPRPRLSRLSREELILYLGDTRPVPVPTGEDFNPSSRPENSASAPEVAVELEVAVVEGEEKGKGSSHNIIGGDVNHNQAALPAANVEGGEAVERGGGGGAREGGDDGDVAPARRIPRRWPSSADIGMVTDGR